MKKTHIYFVPGLAANTKIFEHIILPKDFFGLHFLDWIKPISTNESIESYAKRMCDRIEHENPILVGVSFGGILIQEMSKIIPTQKLILISSIKSKHELPTRLKLIQKTKAYKLVPTKVIEHIEDYERYFLGDYLKKRAELYKLYLSMRDATYLQWAIHNVLNWKQEKEIENIVHIHGTNDEVFPSKNIKKFIPVEKGSHAMIIYKAKTISKILQNECFS